MKTSENTILITGAASGIGLEIARLFSQCNNKIIMVDRSAVQLESEAAKLHNTVAIPADLTNEDELSKLIQKVKLNYSEINVAILNAAAAYNHTLYTTEFDQAYAKSEINTNYLANVRLSHALEPLLSKKKEAAIVITTSGLAYVPNLEYPTYSVTKATLHSFVLGSRLQLQRNGSNVKMFELMPPLVDTPLAEALNAPKITAAEVASAFMTGFAKDELEIRVGDTENIFQLFLRSPQEALMAVNGGK
ncbi:SDR family NAD(P)-dependent oxidoreductase [Mucilaginibacter roseus]|uniref:SDR family NAD(P)-dependent oxidoreductase n=1 Tax=Mucilaginibacter roseus TaxID=1528868 RepID=A0ABS8TZV3_9SPHI|nr:SDR family NAD(P)-dependent oxidoreductase [Mucilaginibacter roseus]MCD8739014.1 SDR family NAD(P)-dependent oxidoreductase [Mucilaginibacter roseus]